MCRYLTFIAETYNIVIRLESIDIFLSVLSLNDFSLPNLVFWFQMYAFSSFLLINKEDDSFNIRCFDISAWCRKLSDQFQISISI